MVWPLYYRSCLTSSSAVFQNYYFCEKVGNQKTNKWHFDILSDSFCLLNRAFFWWKGSCRWKCQGTCEMQSLDMSPSDFTDLVLFKRINFHSFLIEKCCFFNTFNIFQDSGCKLIVNFSLFDGNLTVNHPEIFYFRFYSKV